jgi:hypothetical protein
MEASMTRLQTSWQSFTQSIIESKAVIGIVNAINGMLTGVTNFIEGGSPVTKALLGTVTTILITYIATNKLAKSLGLETDRNNKIKLQQLEAEKQLAALNAKQYIESQNFTKEQQEYLALLEQQRQAEQEINNIKEQREAIDNSDMNDDQKRHAKDDLDNRQAAAQQRYDEANSGMNKIINQTTEAGNPIDATSDEMVAAEQAINKKIAAEQKYANAVSKSNSVLIKQKQQEMETLKLKKDALQAEKNKLEAMKKGTKDVKEQEKIQRKIDKITKQINKNQVNIEKKQRDINNVSNNSLGLFKQIGSSIGMSISSGLSNIFSFLGPIGYMLGDIVSITAQ